MVNWLGIANQLALAKTHLALTEALYHALADAFGARNSYLFTVCADGRQLVCLSQTQRLSCSVTDFTSSLAHVLQQGKAKKITNSDLAYWQQDVLFKNSITHIPAQHAVFIVPLRTTASDVIFALLVSVLPLTFCQSRELVSEQGADNHYEQLLTLFSLHWLIIIERQQSQLDKGLLTESLLAANQMQQQVRSEQGLASKLVGQSACMQDLRAQVAKAAHVTKTVLIQGDVGVGKRIVAEQIHEYSPRQEQPWVVINCAYLGAFRLERALFGYVKGAFEGATKSQLGALGAAKAGTLYLDNVEQLPLALQAKLMHVLSSGSYQSLGSDVDKAIECRLITSSTKHLKDCVRNKTFRQDLFYRLHQFPINVPSLTRRKEDIHPLAHYFVKQFNSANQAQICGVHYEAIDALMELPFDGNVRELQSIIEFGCSHVEGTEPVMLKHIERYFDESNEAPAYGLKRSAQDSALAMISNLPHAVKRYEKEIIESRLKSYSGNRAMAAQSLGIPKRTLADKCIKMEIDV